jgi:hypothetical protein
MIVQLRAVRDAAHQRGAGLIVVVVVPDAAAHELPADRVQAVCQNLALNPKCAPRAPAPCCLARPGGARPFLPWPPPPSQ